MPSKDYLMLRSAQQGASRSTHHLAATPLFGASVNFLTAAKAGMTKEGSGNQALSSHRYESQPSISSYSPASS